MTTSILNARVSPATRARVLALVNGASQPVTATEILMALASTKHPSSVYTINVAMRGLVADGSLVSREETPDERLLRTDGQAKGRQAKLYWPAGADGRVVPERTMRSVLDGVQTVAGVNLKKSRPAGAPVQTGNRIDRLEQEIRDLKAIVASLVKALG